MSTRKSRRSCAAVALATGLMAAAARAQSAGGDGPLYPLVANLSPPLAIPSFGDGSTSDVPPSHRLLDLDGDGHLDAISLYRGCSTWHGIGDGRFEEGIEWPSGQHMRLGTLADMNGDGRLDAVLPDYGDVFAQPPGAIVVLLGTADGGFGPPVISSLTADPVALTAADFDGDGLCDVAAFMYGLPGSPRLWMLPGLGTGALAATVANAPVMNFPEEMRHADLDGDGVLDVVITHQDGGCCFCLGSLKGDLISRFRGLGDGDFTEMVPYLCTVNLMRHLEVVDLNEDSRPDLLLQCAQTTSYLPNLGGPFGMEVPVASSGSASLAFESSGDLFDYAGGASTSEGDGHPDLLTSGKTSHSLLPGLGSGAFGGPVASNAFGFEPLGLGDVDEDGRLDVAASVNGTNVVLRGFGDGTFEGPRLLLSGMSAPIDVNWSIVKADLNADGVPDFAGTSQYIHKVVVLLSQGTAGYAAPVSYPLSGDTFQLQSGDFDGDGQLDLLVRVSFDPVILPGTGDGAFGAPLVLPGAWNWLVATGDLDGDGRTDIVSTVGGDPVVLFAQGGFAFSAPTVIASGFTPSVGVARDLDGDGLDDLVLSPGWTLVAMLSRGDGTFAPPLHMPFEGTLDHLDVVDIDGDGAVDVLATDNEEFSDGRVSILLNLGAGEFAAVDELRTLGRVNDVEAADVDRDGWIDLVAGTSIALSGSTGPVLLIYRGNGSGEFAPPLTYGAGTTPIALSIHDANADGWPDLYVVGSDRLVLSEHQWGPWKDRGHALAGIAGRPHVDGQGPLVAGTPVAFELTSAAPSSPSALVLGVAEALLPFKGGVLVPSVNVVVPGLSTNALGRLKLQSTWPAGIPSQAMLRAQFWVSDAAAPAGLSASNGVLMTVP